MNDGVVIAADSATTMSQLTSSGSNNIMNIYNNANKVFNLHKKLPVGLITWGLGNIGSSSISTLIKDFRQKICKENTIDVNEYTVQQFAESFYNFIYTDRYYKWGLKNVMGFLIVGYSKNSDHPEEWLIQIEQDGECSGPLLVGGHNYTGCRWYGQPEAITRLLRGHSGALELILHQANIPQEQINTVMQLTANNLSAPIISPAMPIQDAIDIAKFLIETTINYIKFMPGEFQTVGGPIEIAAITKHEGFKWINRKLYFNEKIQSKEE